MVSILRRVLLGLLRLLVQRLGTLKYPGQQARSRAKAARFREKVDPKTKNHGPWRLPQRGLGELNPVLNPTPERRKVHRQELQSTDRHTQSMVSLRQPRPQLVAPLVVEVGAVEQPGDIQQQQQRQLQNHRNRCQCRVATQPFVLALGTRGIPTNQPAAAG